MTVNRPDRANPLMRVAGGSSDRARDKDMFGGTLRQVAIWILAPLCLIALTLIDSMLGLPHWAKLARWAPVAFVGYVVLISGYQTTNWWLSIDEKAKADPRIKPWARFSAKYGAVSLVVTGIAFVAHAILASEALNLVGIFLGSLVAVSLLATNLGSIYLDSPDGIYRAEE